MELAVRDLPDDYHVCRGLVSLLLDRRLEYPGVQVTCSVDRAGPAPVYVVSGNRIAKAVLSEVLECVLGRPFVLDEKPWRLTADDAEVLVRIGNYPKYKAA